MKTVCLVFLLVTTVFRLVAKFSGKPPKDDNEAIGIIFGAITGFVLQVTAIWYLSGFTLQ